MVWTTLIDCRFLSCLCIIRIGWKPWRAHIRAAHACSIPYLNPTTARAPFSNSFPWWRRGLTRARAKGRAKLKVAKMLRELLCECVFSTGCLFNMARMWIPWGKIPERQTSGPLVCWCQTTQTVSVGLWDSCPQSSEPFLYQGRRCGLCALCVTDAAVVFSSIWRTFTLSLNRALHLFSSYFLIKTAECSSCVVQWKYWAPSSTTEQSSLNVKIRVHLSSIFFYDF